MCDLGNMVHVLFLATEPDAVLPAWLKERQVVPVLQPERLGADTEVPAPQPPAAESEQWQ